MTEKFQTTRRNFLRVAGVGAGLGLSGAGLLSEGVQLGEAKTSSSIQPWIIENFEDGSLSEYNIVYGGSSVSTATDLVYDGSYALKINGGDTKLFRPEFAGAPTQGTNFSTRTRVSSGSPLVLLTYGVQDKNNFYTARLRFDTNKLSILKKENGTWTELTGCYCDFSFQQDVWYELEVDWSENGDHTVTATGGGETATTAGTDSTWSSGGIGFWCFTNSSSDIVHYDYVVEHERQVDGINVEDFEDGNLDEYAIYYGDTAASVTSAAAYTRDRALMLAGADVNMANATVSPAPVRGDTFSVRVRMAGAPISLFHYGVQDADNFYSLRLRPDTDEISILKHESGGWTELTGTTMSFDLRTDLWYKLELNWSTGGEHTLTVSGDGDSASVTGTDTTWSRGGIGFMQYASTGDVTHYDSVQMEPILGNYEWSNDGWTASGSSSLTRKSEDQVPASVTKGTQALEVTIQGESNPSIECQERVVAANCSKNAYLLADVLPSVVENSASPVTFQFRYHHTSPGGVEESPEMTVDQTCGQTLAWDMSHLSEEKLTSPDRVEVSWYPTEHPPSSGFDYNGRVVVDNVRFSSDQNEVTHAMNIQKHSDLNRAHGRSTDRVIQSQSETLQEGVYKYPDGTEIPYQAEKLGNGVIEETVDGTTLRWEVGSQ